MTKVTIDTIERIVPDHMRDDEVTGRETLELHLERYRFAVRHIRPGRLLDIACGVGYGTALLAVAAQGWATAIGVDISSEAIAYARHRYGAHVLQFVEADAMTFADSSGFDTIVSIETIEHLREPRKFIQRLATLLRPSGILVGSVPTTPSVDANPYHLHDFTERSFKNMFLECGLVEVDVLRQIQRFNPRRLLGGKEKRSHTLRKNLLKYYLMNPHSLGRRITSTLRYGFTNRYITIAWRAPDVR